MRIFGELLDGEKVAASVKADLIKFLYEQQHGKAKSKIDVDATVGPREALAAAIVLDDGLPQEIIEGTFTEDDYDEDEHEDDLGIDPVRTHGAARCVHPHHRAVFVSLGGAEVPSWTGCRSGTLSRITFRRAKSFAEELELIP
jgi:hypothetical protein